jgi:hypothetical protein
MNRANSCLCPVLKLEIMQELFKKVFHLEQDLRNINSEICILQSKHSNVQESLFDFKTELWKAMESEQVLFVGNEGVYYLCKKGKQVGYVEISNIDFCQL